MKNIFKINFDCNIYCFASIAFSQSKIACVIFCIIWVISISELWKHFFVLKSRSKGITASLIHWFLKYIDWLLLRITLHTIGVEVVIYESSNTCQWVRWTVFAYILQAFLNSVHFTLKKSSIFKYDWYDSCNSFSLPTIFTWLNTWVFHSRISFFTMCSRIRNSKKGISNSLK